MRRSKRDERKYALERKTEKREKERGKAKEKEPEW